MTTKPSPAELRRAALLAGARALAAQGDRSLAEVLTWEAGLRYLEETAPEPQHGGPTALEFEEVDLGKRGVQNAGSAIFGSVIRHIIAGRTQAEAFDLVEDYYSRRGVTLGVKSIEAIFRRYLAMTPRSILLKVAAETKSPKLAALYRREVKKRPKV